MTLAVCPGENGASIFRVEWIYAAVLALVQKGGGPRPSPETIRAHMVNPHNSRPRNGQGIFVNLNNFS